MVWKPKPTTKHFDGKVFRRGDSFLKKKNARDERDLLKRHGMNARVTKEGKKWVVWARRK